MTGLLKPSSGQILVDGFDINKSSNNWQQQIGYVPQDIYLLDETIKANISFGVDKNEFNEENFSRAVELAQLKDFIKSLPDKENTQVGDRGIRLSGGQKQRIGIARSLYFKPKILIFDEPTSALDVENEKKIIDDLYKLSGQLTIIIVSHRQTVFDKCSKVLQIENGKIEEKII
jgi:ABC-type bacteriocin/lantibiotic exporter with double-glycine peptidase domain